MNNRKTFLTLGVVFFGITIIFALIFTWTLNVGTSTYYIRIDGYWVVKDFDTLNEFQSVYAIISIISSVFAVLFSVLGIWLNDKNQIK